MRASMIDEFGTPGGVTAAAPGEANDPPTAVGRPAVAKTPPPNPLLVGFTADSIDDILSYFLDLLCKQQARLSGSRIVFCQSDRRTHLSNTVKKTTAMFTTTLIYFHPTRFVERDTQHLNTVSSCMVESIDAHPPRASLQVLDAYNSSHLELCVSFSVWVSELY